MGYLYSLEMKPQDHLFVILEKSENKSTWEQEQEKKEPICVLQKEEIEYSVI